MNEILPWKIYKSYYTGYEELKVLKHVNLIVYKGEFISILGPSIWKININEYNRVFGYPTSGKYTLSGINISETDDIQLAKIQQRNRFCFSKLFSASKINCRQNVELPLIYSGIPKINVKKRRWICTGVGLSDKINNLPNQLSGGQQQRVAIARR